MVKKLILGIVMLMACASLSAQIAGDQDKDKQYVTDQLRLSLYSNPDAQSQVLQLLSSGDLLLIEEISGNYARVISPNGTRGWVKRGFLVTKPTSNLLLREEEQKTAALEAEIEKLSNSKAVIDQYEKDMDKLVEKIDAMETDKQDAQQSIAALREQVAEKEQELEKKLDDSTPPPLLALRDNFLLYWPYIVPIILVIMLLTYLLSKVVIETRIKAKFHGIKIW